MLQPFAIKLITADKSLLKWRSLPAKLRAIYDELDDIEGAQFTIDIEYRDISPEVKNGRVTHEWMDKLRADIPYPQYEFVAFHMTQYQRRKWGIKQSLKGSQHHDLDLVEEFWFSANQTEWREGLDAFVQRFLHEFRHAWKHGCGQFDDTHAQHADGDIRHSFKGLKSADFNPSRSIITKLTNLITSMEFKIPATPVHPVQFKPLIISQPYGRLNASYPRTGRHIGTDYAIPVGTPLYAPLDGKIVTSGWHPDLGFFLHLEYFFDGQNFQERWCHLRDVAKTGPVKRGKAIAISGNTGRSTGPHLHREKWYNEVRTDLINKTNWAKLTVDPEL